jgi:hypothetical protein
MIDTNELRKMIIRGEDAAALREAIRAATEIDHLRVALRDCRDELCAMATSRTNDGEFICLSCLNRGECKPDCAAYSAINAANNLLP